jgi:hypothetical protein
MAGEVRRPESEEGEWPRVRPLREGGPASSKPNCNGAVAGVADSSWAKRSSWLRGSPQVGFAI